MKKESVILILRIVALSVGIISTIVFVPWPIVWQWAAPLPDNVQAQVEQALEHDFDGIIVYVDEAGSQPAFYSAGWHDRDAEIPADPDALFKIASISKLYVAVAAVKLVSDGRLSLDTTLAEYFPSLAGRLPYAEEITLRLMLQHRSGLANITDAPGFWENPPASSEEALELISDWPANFAPNQDYGYSNTNYMLIADLIDKTVGYSHHRFIKERILEPLALNNTFSSIHEVDMDRVMSGYYVGIEQDIKFTDYGSMLASAEDVGRFIRALNDGSVFDGDEQDIYSSVYVYDHTGLIPGYQSIARYHADIDSVVVQFTNTTDFSDYMNWGLSEGVYNRVIKILRRDKGL